MKKSKIKVAWLLDDFPGPYQAYIINLYNTLALKTEFDITIFAHRTSSRFDNNINVIKVSNNFKHFYQLLKYINIISTSELEIKLSKYDIVHVQHSFLYPMISDLVKQEIKTKFVITFRGADTYVKPWINKSWIKNHLEIYEFFDAIQVMSENQKDYLKKWGYLSEKIYNIPISIGTDDSQYVHFELNETIHICSIFRFVWEKNIEANLRFIKCLRDIGFNVKYNVFGDGVDIGQFYYLIDKFNLSECVIMHGRLSPKNIKVNLKKQHFLLQISTSDALPASVIEAFSFGIPCIVSDVGGLPEIVQDGYNGFVVDFNKYNLHEIALKIKNIKEDCVKYIFLRKNAFKTFLDSFTPQIEADKISRMYYEILEN